MHWLADGRCASPTTADLPLHRHLTPASSQELKDDKEARAQARIDAREESQRAEDGTARRRRLHARPPDWR
jgi:hypothetical protein